MDDELGRAAEDYGADLGEAITTILAGATTEAWLDAMALIAAFWDDDADRAKQVMMLMDEPELTAAQLARSMAMFAKAAGMPRSTLSELQVRAALGE